MLPCIVDWTRHLRCKSKVNVINTRPYILRFLTLIRRKKYLCEIENVKNHKNTNQIIVALYDYLSNKEFIGISIMLYKIQTYVNLKWWKHRKCFAWLFEEVQKSHIIMFHGLPQIQLIWMEDCYTETNDGNTSINCYQCFHIEVTKSLLLLFTFYPKY